MRTSVAVLLVVSLFTFSPSARADVLPLDDCGMKHKKEGEACKDTAGKDGACGTITYTATNHATNPPTQSQRSYLGCRTGEKPTASAAPKKGCSASPQDAEGGALLLGAVGVILASRRRARRVG